MTGKLIACHGLPGAGKDAFAKHIMKSGGWRRVAFAEPLKRGLEAMLGIPMEDIENPEIKNAPNYKFGRSIRYMAQTIGTEWGRRLIIDSIWVDLAEEKIRKAWDEGLGVIITDLRFENEAIRVHELGGKTIHIIRDNNKHTDESAKNGVASHPSDVVLSADYIDYQLLNNGSLSEFYSECERLTWMATREP